MPYNVAVPVGERGLLDPTELWPQEQQLCAKAAEGGLLDLRRRRPGEDEPFKGSEWDARRRIRAQVLFQLLTGHGPTLADSVVAVRLRGAQIVGRLNLGGWRLRCPLELSECHLGRQLDVAKAEAPNLNLRGTYLRGLSARRLKVAHTLNLSGVRCDGAVKFRDAHISGHLFCAEAIFDNHGGRALSADGLTVDRGMFLSGARCTGEVRLLGAHIGVQLVCAGAVFTNRDGDALSADGLTVDGAMFLDNANCTGEVRLLGAHINGQLSCVDAVFRNDRAVP